MTPARAEEIAIAALAWIAGADARLTRFLALSGAGIEDLRAQATEPDFLGFVLDFLMSDEALLLEFSREEGISPETPARARAHLPGGDLPDWT